MGLIKKKTSSRGTEGGVKYVCDVCSSDVTATVSLASLAFPLYDGLVLITPGPHSLRPPDVP